MKYYNPFTLSHETIVTSENLDGWYENERSKLVQAIIDQTSDVGKKQAEEELKNFDLKEKIDFLTELYLVETEGVKTTENPTGREFTVRALSQYELNGASKCPMTGQTQYKVIPVNLYQTGGQLQNTLFISDNNTLLLREGRMTLNELQAANLDVDALQTQSFNQAIGYQNLQFAVNDMNPVLDDDYSNIDEVDLDLNEIANEMLGELGIQNEGVHNVSFEVEDPIKARIMERMDDTVGFDFQSRLDIEMLIENNNEVRDTFINLVSAYNHELSPNDNLVTNEVVDYILSNPNNCSNLGKAIRRLHDCNPTHQIYNRFILECSAENRLSLATGLGELTTMIDQYNTQTNRNFMISHPGEAAIFLRCIANLAGEAYFSFMRGLSSDNDYQPKVMPNPERLSRLQNYPQKLNDFERVTDILNDASLITEQNIDQLLNQFAHMSMIQERLLDQLSSNSGIISQQDFNSVMSTEFLSESQNLQFLNASVELNSHQSNNHPS
ncbi:hypothetical protein [Fangia hongkongensis]|uniref:hypothetical protein n=1 Tax=Fangia hongkongensis TaxID=270495 RepID=UPI000382D148|nr:hypothetical protein [Fangia hongkongensis]MBK2124353.1 hypothetical protein [Fangia hongkongensis]